MDLWLPERMRASRCSAQPVTRGKRLCGGEDSNCNVSGSGKKDVASNVYTVASNLACAVWTQPDSAAASFRHGLFVAGQLLWSALAQLVAEFRIVLHHLRIEKEKVPHLVERGAQSFNRLGLRLRVQRLHQFRVAGSLHGGTVELSLNGAQVFGDARDPEL